MAKDVLFRNSIGGYNKDDVRRYIDDLNIQFTDREDELEGEIRLLKKELEVLPALEAEKERAENLSKELETVKQENLDLSSAIEAQGKELEEKTAALSEITAEKDALDLRVKELVEREEKLQADSAKLLADYNMKVNELKALNDETDKIKENLEEEKSLFEIRANEMLVRIQDEAKAIIDKANETAELIVSSAKRKADDLSTSARSAEISYTAAPAKKDNLSDIFDAHKSKMDSFFSGIVKAFKGDNK